MLRAGAAFSLGHYLIPVPLGRKKDPFCSYIRKPITQKVKRIFGYAQSCRPAGPQVEDTDARGHQPYVVSREPHFGQLYLGVSCCHATLSPRF